MTAPVDSRSDVLVFFSDAGGGHRRAAGALVAAADELGAPLRFRLVSLSEVLADLDVMKRLTGHSIENIYNALLRSGHTGFLVPLLRLLHGVERLLRGPVIKRVAARLRAERPRLVLSAHPNFNAALRQAARQALPQAPFVVLMTDYADFPPHFWIEPDLDRLIVGSTHAHEQARTLGVAAERIVTTSGMVLHPAFYRGGGPESRTRVRSELGIPPLAQVVLMLFGGKGSAEMEPLAEALLRTEPAWHVIGLCGDNPDLRARFEQLAAAAGGRLHGVGFTDSVADYMAAADVLLTKPGPGSLAEAFHLRLPVVVTGNPDTIPQERWNAAMVAREGLGLVAPSWREMPAAAQRLLQDAELRGRVLERLAALPHNRAVFEAVEAICRELGLALAKPRSTTAG